MTLRLRNLDHVLKAIPLQVLVQGVAVTTPGILLTADKTSHCPFIYVARFRMRGSEFGMMHRCPPHLKKQQEHKQQQGTNILLLWYRC